MMIRYTFLQEWVTKWLDEQLIWADHHKKQSERNAKNGKIDEDLTDKSTDEKQDSHCSPAETMSNNGLNSSATTSQCETGNKLIFVILNIVFRRSLIYPFKSTRDL